MSEFSRLPDHRPGSVIEKWAMFCAALAVICVLGAHGMDRLAKSGQVQLTFNRTPSTGIDYSGTASIPNRPQAQPVNPCGRN